MTDTQGLQFETLLNNTRIENAEKVRKKTFVFFAIWLLYVQLLGAEQIRACVSRTYVQSAWLPINDEGRNDALIASTVVRLY